MKDKKIKVPIRVSRYTLETAGGELIYILTYHEYGNAFVKVYRGLNMLGAYTRPDEHRRLKLAKVIYGDSILSKKAYINILLCDVSIPDLNAWEINCPDSKYDPITNEDRADFLARRRGANLPVIHNI